MACPSGCIGGAGNPLPNINKLEEVRAKRIEVLNKMDENSKLNMFEIQKLISFIIII